MEKTGLEQQEGEVKNVLFGNPGAMGGAVDKSMLEMTETNRLVYDRRQSELQIAVKTLHTALVLTDNRKPEYKRVKDSASDKWHTQRVTRDVWGWVRDMDRLVMTNQLTIRGYSRAQHLRQSAQQMAVSVEEETDGGNFWTRLFGGR